MLLDLLSNLKRRSIKKSLLLIEFPMHIHGCMKYDSNETTISEDRNIVNWYLQICANGLKGQFYYTSGLCFIGIMCCIHQVHMSTYKLDTRGEYLSQGMCNSQLGRSTWIIAPSLSINELCVLL